MSFRTGLEELGEKLVGLAIVYITISLILSYVYIASGGDPPPFLPGFVVSAFAKTVKAWDSIRGLTFSTSSIQVLLNVANLITNAVQVVLSVLVTLTFVYIWIAYQVTSLLPYPLSILAIPVWVMATIATWVMVIWLLKKVAEVISSYIPYTY